MCPHLEIGSSYMDLGERPSNDWYPYKKGEMWTQAHIYSGKTAMWWQQRLPQAKAPRNAGNHWELEEASILPRDFRGEWFCPRVDARIRLFLLFGAIHVWGDLFQQAQETNTAVFRTFSSCSSTGNPGALRTRGFYTCRGPSVATGRPRELLQYFKGLSPGLKWGFRVRETQAGAGDGGTVGPAPA